MMRKRLLSLILAGLMGLSLAACQNDVVDDGENSDQQQEIQDKEQSGDELLAGEYVSDVGGAEESDKVVNTVELNVQLPLESEPLQVETPEKVLKLTVSSESDSSGRLIPIAYDTFELPAGATFEYDVYLENAVKGYGMLEFKYDGGAFVSGENGLDQAGFGYSSDEDLSFCAYGRWYHRVFDVPADRAGLTASRLRFAAGALAAGSSVVCYFDNICVKDANGNVMFSIDEEIIAANEIRTTGGVSCNFEVVDDPAPTVKRASADDILYKDEISDAVTGKDSIEVKFELDNLYSSPAIYVGTPDENSFYGIQGYVLTLRNDYLCLYKASDSGLTEVAEKRILGLIEGREFGLRLDIDGDELRGYFLDDMAGVEPWPEFVVPVEDLTGQSCGVLDITSQGSLMKTVTVSEIEAVTVGESYTNYLVEDVADPDVLYYDGMYYLYGTYGANGYHVFSSADLVNWEYKGLCLENPGACWAPDVEYYNGKFYMACTIDRTLVIAVSDSPLGPFIVDPEPILGFVTFDGHFFIDDDGQAYIYYSTYFDGRPYGIYGAKFDFETRTMDYSTEVGILFPEIEWETYGRNGEVGGNAVVEGAYLLKHNGLYYMTYSGGDYGYKGYAVGVAVSESPLGPFVKYEGNPIHIGNSSVHGTAHHSFTVTPDGELMIVYHCHNSLVWDGRRSTCIDKARFAPTESGIDRIETYGPTTTPQEMPLN